MESTVLILLAVLLLIAIGIAAWAFTRRRRTQELRERFGPEYNRAVEAIGDQRRAEEELETRQERVERLNIRSLSPEERKRFAEAWHSTQALFVDDPSAAIKEADRLVTEVMRVRGYPVADFEQRAADISVDHPDVVSNYRGAHAIALANQRGEASTEDLRKAIVYYRALFEELLETGEREREEVLP
ncbi:MAG: hypothetical protein M5U01_03940 [Ardenticatenaceae bacterium]|nr:hypothetical protein [Ardenticatenaceae bacterium]